MTAPIPVLKPITVTLEQAGILSGLGRTKLYELIGSGHLETSKIGRRRLVKMDSLERLLSVGTS